jgi:hypothetical protein
MASWEYIDLMCVYSANRAHLPRVITGYGLDSILNKELNLGKLKFPDLTDEESSHDRVKWHKEMSSKHIVEYTLYAIFDVLGPMLLEHKTRDIGVQYYNELGGVCLLKDFKSNPRKLSTSTYFYFLKAGAVMGAPSNKIHPYDNMVYNGTYWIVTLNSNYHDQLGSKSLKDSDVETTYIPNTNDDDLVSSYPSNQRAINGCKHTRVTEMIDSEDLPLKLLKELGLSLSSNGGNSVNIAVNGLGLPDLDEIVEVFDGDYSNY